MLTVLLGVAMLAAAVRSVGKRMQNRRIQDEKLAVYFSVVGVWQALIKALSRPIRLSSNV